MLPERCRVFDGVASSSGILDRPNPWCVIAVRLPALVRVSLGEACLLVMAVIVAFAVPASPLRALCRGRP
jgi:hypothetical protein